LSIAAEKRRTVAPGATVVAGSAMTRYWPPASVPLSVVRGMYSTLDEPLTRTTARLSSATGVRPGL